ncbi:MAG: phosphate starvation-inducible protein PhoH [Crocinitomicaceae bacterium]|nr:phosphate starvation-inducible protein PhoH [Crocinitomicaceae bacterium]
MQEKVFEFDSSNPVEIFGANNSNIDLLRKYFPKLKIIARGSALKVFGSLAELEQFSLVMHDIYSNFKKFNRVLPADIERILESDAVIPKSKDTANNTIVRGVNGEPIKARTPNQLNLVESVEQNDMVFAIGPAGTGKTYTAVALAVKAFRDKEVKRIILTRPAVEAGENLGFLPGDLKEKLDPYLQPLYDALREMIPAEKLNSLIENGGIQIAPLAFMRGRTLDKAFVILDEAQNATESQLKMFLTRMGRSAKFMITGDLTQIDLPKNQNSGLVQAEKVLSGVDGIGFVYLDEKDVIRHRLVRRIIKRYDKANKDNG